MVVAAIYLLGAVHGFILALVLVQKKINKLPNKLLGLMMVAFSVDLGMAAFLSFGWHGQYPHLIGIDYPVTLLYGPLLYLYVKSMRDGSEKIQAFDYIHFIPFLILVIYLIPFYIGPAADKIALVDNTSGQQNGYGFAIINDIKILHALAYTVGVVYMLVSYRRKLKNSYSSIENVNLNWLQHFIAGVVLLAAIGGGIYFFTPPGSTVFMGMSDIGFYDDITLLATTVFVYGIGYMGLHQPEVFSSTMRNDLSESSPNEGGRQKPTETYQKSGLNKEEAQRYTRQLTQLMTTKKLYRNSELTLGDLAEELEVSAHNLTEVINRYVGQNFYDFINSYRVEEVKQQLTESKSENLTLLSIGLDAGFNSKSTFNAVFKKQTGMTPSQFRKQHQ